MDEIEKIKRELGIPKKYIKIPNTNHPDRVLVLTHKTWINSLIETKQIPEFIIHEVLSEDEVLANLHQGEKFSKPWYKILIQIIKKPADNEFVIALPRPRPTHSNYESGLSYNQLLHYISETNHRNLWKYSFKKYMSNSFQGQTRETIRSNLCSKSKEIMREVITRLYGCNIILMNQSSDMSYSSPMRRHEFDPHPNILPALCAIETKSNFFVLHPLDEATTLKDCVTFSPALLGSCYSKPLFVIYQLIQLMKDCHDRGLVLGDLQLHDIYLNDTLLAQVLPSIEDNLYRISSAKDVQSSSSKESWEWRKWGPAPGIPQEGPEMRSLVDMCNQWVHGKITNFDYLMSLNRLAGRRFGDPTCHYIMPWVSDLSTKSSGTWRDFTKSKFRLNKGDQQLDLTYESAGLTNQVPHHVTDVLSEITYYVYLARKTPRSLLCKYVRANWVPAEYPTSIQRLQHWTPDECIPEFYSDPSIFKSIHEDLTDLELPPWALTPEEFVEAHRAALESRHVSERLHHWIDLTFGYKLSGSAAIKAKNVCLQLVDNHTSMVTCGIVQLFSFPHPPRLSHIPFFDKVPPRLLQPDKRKGKTRADKVREAVSEEEAHSSGNEEDESLEMKSSPLVLSRLMSRSRGSLLGPFHSSEDISRCDQSRSSSTSSQSSIFLPKDCNPAALLTSVETTNNFFKKTFSTVPVPDNQLAADKNSRANLKQVVAAKRIQEMKVLGCLIVEMFLNSKLRVTNSIDLQQRVSVCSACLNSDALPRCVRSAARLLLQLQPNLQYLPVTNVGLPPPSAHQLIQPLLSSFIFPFPRPFPTMYSAICSLVTASRVVLTHCLLNPGPSQDCESLTNMKVNKFFSDLDKLWDDMLSVKHEQLIDLLVPFVRQLFNDPLTSRLSIFLLLDKVARGLGPRRSHELLIDSVLSLYDNAEPASREGLHLYHKHFLQILMVRLGLKVFLENFIGPLVETVGRYKETSNEKWRCDVKPEIDALESDLELALSPAEEDFSPEENKNVPPRRKETLAEIAVFTFDKEDVHQSEGYDSGDLADDGVGTDMIDVGESESEGVSHEEAERGDKAESSGIKSPDIAIPGSNLRHNFATIQCEVGSKSTGSQNENHFPKGAASMDNHFENRTIENTAGLQACDVAADSIMWLSHRLGPVLTSRYITRNLLRMLSLCYTGRDSLEPLSCNMEDKALRLSVCKWKVIGDENAESVVKVLCEMAQIYSEQIILLQYLPHMSELIGLSKRKFTVSLEGGVIGCMTLLQHIVPLLNDSTLMDQLQDVILKNMIHPVVRLVSSTRFSFPSGYHGRYTLVSKLVDVLYLISVRIGSEMTKAHLAVPSLQRFFLAFDKAQGVRSTLLEPSKNESPLRSVDDSILEIRRDGTTTEWSVRGAPGLPVSFAHVRSSDASEWANSPPIAVAREEQGRSKTGQGAESELRRVFNAELAHHCYITFLRFLGEAAMDNMLKNHDRVREFCFQYEALHSVQMHPGNHTSHANHSNQASAHDYEPEKGGSGSFGSNVAVIGNKIELQSMDMLSLETAWTGLVCEEVLASVSKRIEESPRHLRGNWLAYWEHEIGRSDKDNMFNFKQMKLMTFTGHTNNVRLITCMDNENSFITGSRDKTVKLWSLRSQGDGSCSSSYQFSYNQHRKSLLSLSFLPSLRLIASCDSTIHIWDPFYGKTIAILDNPRVAPVNVLKEVTPPSCNLIAGTTDSTLKMVDARLCNFVSEYKVSWSQLGLIRSLCVSPNGHWVAVGQASGHLTVLDLRTGMVLASWKGHEGEVLQLSAVSESLLLSSSLDQTVSVWTVADGKLKFHMKGPTEPVHCLAMFNNELITCTTANRIGVHTSIDGHASFSSTKLRSDTFRGVLAAMGVLPLNKLLLLGADNGNVTLLC